MSTDEQSVDAGAGEGRGRSAGGLVGDDRCSRAPRTSLAQAEASATVYGQSSTYTELPAVGQIVSRGETLYEISGQPVVAAVRIGRAVAGVHRRDVAGPRRRGAEREPARARLRRRPRGDAFTAATASAIDALPGGARPRARPGELLLGSVVFEPGAVRVTSVTPTLGATVQPGPVLGDHLDGAAGDDRSSTPRSSREVKVGDPVTITLPDNSTTPGRVSYVGTVATTPSSSSGQGGGGSSTPTIEVDVTPTDPAATGHLDQAPVNVSITTASVEDALVVPVNALLALASGGYAVEEVGAGGVHHLVGVQLGLFDDADGLVQVTGSQPRSRPARRGAEPMSVTASDSTLNLPTRVATAAGPVLELERGDQDLRQRAAVVALDGVSFSVQRGELLAIVGPSGSGKSTLLHLMGTLDRPSSGTVRVTGLDVAGLSDRELAALRATRIGFVFQQFFLAEHATALENVADGLLYAGVARRRAARRRQPRCSRRSGSATGSRARPTQLSGGERQRVAIARALVGRPAIVLADEPTGNLDSATGAAILALLQELHADGATIAVITHDRDLAARLPRQVEMLDGRIVTDTASGGRRPMSGHGPRWRLALTARAGDRLVRAHGPRARWLGSRRRRSHDRGSRVPDLQPAEHADPRRRHAAEREARHRRSTTDLQVALANTNGCPVTTPLAGIPVTFTAPSSGAERDLLDQRLERGARRHERLGTRDRARVHRQRLAGGYHRRRLIGLRHCQLLAREHRERRPRNDRTGHRRRASQQPSAAATRSRSRRRCSTRTATRSRAQRHLHARLRAAAVRGLDGDRGRELRRRQQPGDRDDRQLRYRHLAAIRRQQHAGPIHGDRLDCRNRRAGRLLARQPRRQVADDRRGRHDEAVGNRRRSLRASRCR